MKDIVDGRTPGHRGHIQEQVVLTSLGIHETFVVTGD